MTRKGQAELALGAGLVFSALGGLFGTVVLIVAAPTLAEFALKFSSFEYFWLVLLGLTCAVYMTSDRPLKGFVSLLLGLLISSIGLNNPAAIPRFTFGSTELLGGSRADSADDRHVRDLGSHPLSPSTCTRSRISATRRWATCSRVSGASQRSTRCSILRGSALGTLVGALPGAGGDIAAWMAYGISQKWSKEPQKFGTGHVEGIVEASSANNAALAGAWIPALVFGIPGDSITAIVIGVLYMKGLNPGPTLFINNPQNIYAVYLLFIIANVIMIPLGFLCIKAAKNILHVPRGILMPVIMLFCVVGSYAMNNTWFDVGVMLIAGFAAFILENNAFPIAPAILGVVLGGMLEQNFVTSMIKSEGNVLAFFERPIAATLGVLTLAVWFLPLLLRRLRRLAGI